MRYGFVIDQRKCIGCHACTTACKSENEVAVGVFRTWVKYVESGNFPNVRRHFSVLRCNHCEDAPCVNVCPTQALHKREDGIVDFDNRLCIGCKACMQACPYDALYIDPNSNTAAKCNYCVHRVEQDLLPACVVVCPEKAIIAGDIDDPSSDIARLIGQEPVTVRKPEQGTKPKVFYLGAEDANLTPEAVARGRSYLWSEVQDDSYVNGIDGHNLNFASEPYVSAATDVTPAWEADPALMKPGAPRVAYDVHHPQPWGWKVSTYLWTKSIAAGSLGLAAALTLFDWSTDLGLLEVAAPILALLFISITAVLLIADLKRPERFWYLLVKPNFTSWLALGGYVLGAFGALATAWLAAGIIDVDAEASWIGLGVLAIPLAVAGAGYTAYLFGQAEGRDFWQSPLLLPHLLIQATVAGAAMLAARRRGDGYHDESGRGLDLDSPRRLARQRARHLCRTLLVPSNDTHCPGGVGDDRRQLLAPLLVWMHPDWPSHSADPGDDLPEWRPHERIRRSGVAGADWTPGLRTRLDQSWPDRSAKLK